MFSKRKQLYFRARVFCSLSHFFRVSFLQFLSTSVPNHFLFFSADENFRFTVSITFFDLFFVSHILLCLYRIFPFSILKKKISFCLFKYFIIQSFCIPLVFRWIQCVCPRLYIDVSEQQKKCFNVVFVYATFTVPKRTFCQEN